MLTARRPFALLGAVLLALSIGAASLPARADARPGRVAARLAAPGDGRGGEVAVEADRLEQTRDGDTLIEGDVVLNWESARIQADRILYREKRYVEAEGDVLVVWGANRIAGSRLTYDLKDERGLVHDAVGQVEPDFHFWAESAETIGKDRVDLRSATVTTCTQPIPYWSFSVSSARVQMDRYAHLRNLRLKVGRVPVFYLPYLVWPVKQDRAAGLLFPEFGSTRDRGRVLTQGMFLPLGRSADATLFAEYYTRAGFGGGGEFRIVPNEGGSAVLNGFYIDDNVSGRGRYRATYRQTQEFRNGFRMVADINQVSDFDFFTDYERELRLASSPTILARLEFSRNGAWTSVNVRDLRREQLFADGSRLIQRTLPEVELRGRSRRLGRSPFYLSFESSAASIQQFGDRADADYFRADLFPVVTMPISPVPWLDVTPSASYRATYYTQRRLLGPNDTKFGLDDPLLRHVASGAVEIVGPKLSRIFQASKAADAPTYKHSVETRLAYSYQQGAKRTDEVLVYDEVDRIIAAQNLFTYGLRTRLFARRPRAEQPLALAASGPIVLPDGTTSEAPAPGGETATEAAGAAGPRRAQKPLEILSLDLRQSRSVDRDLSVADTNGDGLPETSRFSSVEMTGRYRPGERIDLDGRASYNVLFRRVADVSLAGNLRGELARTSFSLIRRAGLGFSGGSPIQDQTQLRLALGFDLLGGKLRFDTDGTYVLHPPAGQKSVPDRRWRMEYYTQCCGFLAEYLDRDFSGVNSRREIRFTVDLRGIGKLIDLHAGEDR